MDEDPNDGVPVTQRLTFDGSAVIADSPLLLENNITLPDPDTEPVRITLEPQTMPSSDLTEIDTPMANPPKNKSILNFDSLTVDELKRQQEEIARRLLEKQREEKTL